MFLAFYSKLVDFSPRFQKSTKRFLYQFMALYDRGEDWKFMNYGFSNTDHESVPPELNPADESNRCSIQLYHHLAEAVAMGGQRVLEIGCGRGGGADYIKRYLGVKSIVGLDYSENGVALCKKTYPVGGLDFLTGDAEALPFADHSFDVIINIESSHCYSNMDNFLSEVRRVLRPGGYFLFADFRDNECLRLLQEQLERSGLIRRKKTDITANVIAALEADHSQKLGFIRKRAPRLFTRVFVEFAGCMGTRVYKRFKTRRSAYLSLILQKPAA
jgi:ubiquinone/menaquinone biosynthesis C-methylase UbiE